MLVDYAVPGPLTGLDPVPAAALEPLATDPVEICAPVHALVLHPDDPAASGLPADRQADNQLRPAAAIVARLLTLDPAPLTVERPRGHRVVGTCRHFAVLTCALLRHRGIAARARCGFATYFQPGRAVDHWVTEYRDGTDGRWVRIDTQVLGQGVVDTADDLEPGQFLTGGEAWLAYRRGEVDAAVFGVSGTDNWGPAEIMGNVVRDLAALTKVELLPWDEWGRMADAYRGDTGEDYAALLDAVTAATVADDASAIVELARHQDLRPPAELVG